MSYVEILTGHDLTEEQWDNQIFSEYIGQLWWKRLMGTGINSIIQVKEDLVKKPGDAITIGLRGRLQGGIVTGNSTGIGNEGSFSYYGQRLTIDNVRVLAKIMDIPMTQKRVGFDVLKDAKEEIEIKSQERLDDEITTAMSVVTTGKVRGRYLYGAADSNWSGTHATDLTNIDNTADQLTTNIIRICKRKATIPVNADGIKMRPMKVENGKNYEEWFTYVAHPYSTRDLFDSDAAWKNAQLNIPPQSNSNSPIFSGSSFKGAYDGVLIYEYDRINLVSSTIQVCHNFLLGAQAAAVVWGQRAKFGEEESDIGHAVSYEIHEIRGVSKLYFTRTNQMDQGIVHSFVAAVAD
ncbi:MAG: DUF4043 family protein [Candidatus Binatia bacterium]|nr:DUF4043 family protein [Candidatus Binatia bacterium]